MSESDNQDNTTKVEIATLVLPSEAAECGLQSGDGTDVLLEAAPETLERLLVDQHPGYGKQTNMYSMAAPVESNARIEAVIDLNAVCENIPGLMPDEFVEILHREQATAMEEYEKDISTGSVKEHRDMEAHEGKTADESTPFLQDQPEKTDLIDAAVLQLSADPFVETLADALPSIPLDPKTTEVETTTDEDENRLAHEAFLIRAVATDHGNKTNFDKSAEQNGSEEDTFILALPQIRPSEESLASAEPSNFGTMFTPLMETAMSDLPTDVEGIELRAERIHVSEEDQAQEKDGEDDLETQGSYDEIHVDLVVKRKVPVIGIFILVISLFCGSSVGVAVALQGDGAGPLTQCYWRLQATAVCLFPLALKKLTLSELAKPSRDDWLIYFPLCALCLGFSITSFVVGFGLTSLANAFILSNLASIIIIVTKLFIGMPVLLMEVVGALIGLAGSVFCSMAPVRSTENTGGSNDDIPARMLLEEAGAESSASTAYAGDAICFASSFATAGYLVLAGRLRKTMDLFVFSFLLFTLSFFLVMIYTIIFTTEKVTLSRHPDHGLFGWTSPRPDRLPVELWLAIVCNIIGSTGFIAVLKYFDPVVVSVVMLGTPAVGSLQGYFAGVAPLPGLQTWIGDAIVVLGSVIVILSGLRKTEHVDVNFSDIATEPTKPIELHSPALSVNPVRKGTPLKASNLIQNRKEDMEDDLLSKKNTKRGRVHSDDIIGNRVVFE